VLISIEEYGQEVEMAAIVNAQTRVGVIVGSLRKASYSRRVSQALIERTPQNWVCETIEIADLPLYNQDLDEKPPRPWTRFREQVAACDALLS
jgi:chromate reductase, NAD(P)H dehydrogenase (quinone)